MRDISTCHKGCRFYTLTGKVLSLEGNLGKSGNNNKHHHTEAL